MRDKSFPFFEICKLLDKLEPLHCRVMPLLPAVRKKEESNIWIEWFRKHRNALDFLEPDDPSVLFTLKPEALTDREYGFDEKTFELLICRALRTTVEQRAMYKKFADGGPYLSVPTGKGSCYEMVRNDIGYRVERLMKYMGRDEDQVTVFGHKDVTVQDIEQTLIIIAAKNKGSSAAIQSLTHPGDTDTRSALADIYWRLQGSQAKWLTRLIFKDFGFRVEEEMILEANHTAFPRHLKVTAKFSIKDLVPIRWHGETGMQRPSVPPKTAEKPSSSPEDEVISASPVAQPAKPVQLLVSPPSTKPFPLSESTASSFNMTQSPTQQLLPKDSTNIEIARKLSTRHLTRSSLRNLTQKCDSPPLLTTSIFPGTGTCTLSPSCHLTNKLFILSPCISSSPYLTENLLSSHGATYITSLYPLTLKLKILPKTDPKTGRRIQKIALVESERKEQTISFVKQIEKLDLKRSNGRHELVEVLDWRVLEKMRGVEKSGEVGEEWKGIWEGERVGVV